MRVPSNSPIRTLFSRKWPLAINIRGTSIVYTRNIYHYIIARDGAINVTSNRLSRRDVRARARARRSRSFNYQRERARSCARARAIFLRFGIEADDERSARRARRLAALRVLKISISRRIAGMKIIQIARLRLLCRASIYPQRARLVAMKRRMLTRIGVLAASQPTVSNVYPGQLARVPRSSRSDSPVRFEIFAARPAGLGKSTEAASNARIAQEVA